MLKTEKQIKLEQCIENLPLIREWCGAHNFVLSIFNNNYHWVFTRSYPRVRIDWYPTTGKTAYNKNWKDIVHLHNYQSVFQYIESKKREKTISGRT